MGGLSKIQLTTRLTMLLAQEKGGASETGEIPDIGGAWLVGDVIVAC